MAAERPESEQKTEQRDNEYRADNDIAAELAGSRSLLGSVWLNISFGLQRRSSFPDPAARACLDHQNADGS
jgi:hypothetical protein